MTVSGEIIKVLDALCEKFGIVIDWTQQNLLPYIQELTIKIVNYELVTSIVWLILLNVPLFILIVWLSKYKKNTKPEDLWDFDSSFTPWVLTSLIVLAPCLTLGSITQVFDIVTCLVFPEKIIFEFITNSGILK